MEFLLLMYMLLASGLVGLIANPCCCSTCILFSNLTAHTIADYTVRSGSWTVTSGSIATTSSNALALYNANSASNSHWNNVAITFGAVGDIAKVVGGYVDDDNYVFGSIERKAPVGGVASYTWKLFKREAGVETLLDSTTNILGTGVTGTLCVGPDKLTYATGGIGGSTFLLTNGLPYSYGTKAGVGTGSVGTSITFTTQQFSNHKIDDAACSQCPCQVPACPAGTYPKAYEVIPTAGACSGTSFILDQSGDNGGNCEYWGTVCGLAAFAQVPVTDAGGVRIQITCTRLFGVNVVTTDCTTLGTGNITTGGGFGCWSTFTIQGIPGP